MVKFWIGVLGISLLGQTPALEKERALGAGLAAEIRRGSKPFEDPIVNAYVRRVGERLAAVVPDRSFRFEVLVTTEASEPIGLPGGFILVPASFFLQAENEAEFAGMVAHAMGHVALRHGTVNANAPRNGAIPLVFMGGWMGIHADSQYRSSRIPAGFTEFISGFEMEADRFGADLAGRAGYDSAALASYVRRVQPEDSPSAGLTPLPPKAERIAALETVGQRTGEVGGSEFLRVREFVRVALRGPGRKAPSLRRN